MLREIERKGDKSIWKSSDSRTGVINFYGVRPIDAKDKPFDDQFRTLRDAREALEAA